MKKDLFLLILALTTIFAGCSSEENKNKDNKTSAFIGSWVSKNKSEVLYLDLNSDETGVWTRLYNDNIEDIELIKQWKINETHLLIVLENGEYQNYTYSFFEDNLMQIGEIIFQKEDKDNPAKHPVFELSAHKLNFSNKEGKDTININSNFKWSIKNVSQWIKTSEITQNNSTLLEINITANKELEEREQLLVFFDKKGNAIDTLYITQEKADELYERNVLIESFEGQNCINCPKAKDVIHSIQEIHSEQRVIAVTIHGGLMSIPAPAGLATPQGEKYVSHWGVESFPNGMMIVSVDC